MRLQADILSQSIGLDVKNKQGKVLGRVTEIIYDKISDDIHYIIIGSNEFFGWSPRYFAIPVSANLVEIMSGNRVIINANEEDLKLAKRISVEKCPKPHFDLNPLIYQLFDYDLPGLTFKKKKHHHKKHKKMLYKY